MEEFHPAVIEKAKKEELIRMQREKQLNFAKIVREKYKPKVSVEKQL